MRKFLYVLTACLILLSTVSIVSAGESDVLVFPSLSAQPLKVIKGMPVTFSGGISGGILKTNRGIKIDLYEQDAGLIPRSDAKHIMTTYTKQRGTYAFTYYPTSTKWYFTRVDIHIPNKAYGDVSQLVKVTVRAKNW